MSASQFSRDHALLSLTSPLGKDALIATRFSLDEGLSQCFHGTIDVVADRARIDPDDLLYKAVCLSIQLQGLPVRRCHGRVRQLIATGPVQRGMHGYRLELVPSLWFLSQTEDCRIFENKSTKDILRAIFGDYEIAFTFRTADPPVRPFTVQYNETDLDFATRLMEEEGWYYFFQHEEQRHLMVIGDSNTSFNRVPNSAMELRAGKGVETLSLWQPGGKTAHGKFLMADYDPEQPNSALKGETATTLKSAGASLRDPFHWPALALKSDAIKAKTRLRIEAAEAEAGLAEGACCNPSFVAGGRIQIIDPPGAAPQDFVLRRVFHEASDESWCNSEKTPAYTNRFTAFLASYPWRPVPTVARPRMNGVYSAIVIGPDGQEIHTDKLGRVKLRFHWDRRHDATPGGAIWVRVMQAWSGANAGWTFIPRIGTEVVVSFVDGDPDRPVVIGQLHNGAQEPPFSLPSEQTRSGLRTRSTPNGGSDDCSELWFDDKKGSELVMLHAQRDLKIEVENDATEEIEQKRSITIKSGDDSLTVQQGDRTVDVTQGKHTIKSTQGDIAIKTALGAVTVEAMKSITLKVGQSSVTLDQSGVTVKGMNISVEGQVMTAVKAPITQIDADGMLKATGGVMMLN